MSCHYWPLLARYGAICCDFAPCHAFRRQMPLRCQLDIIFSRLFLAYAADAGFSPRLRQRRDGHYAPFSA
jgi:hypothetical protein